MNSLWYDTATPPKFDALRGDIKTDVLIIGGGIAGLLCAYMLKNAGIDCTVTEADRICRGVTCDTTAKITYQHGLIYDKLIREFDVDTARMYLKANRDALREYIKLSKNIDCDFKVTDAYVYSRRDENKLLKELEAYQSIGGKADFVKSVPLPVSTVGAVRVKDQAQFHPLKFIYAKASDLKIYENTKVTEITPDCVRTNGGKIHAEKIIIATHFPFINKHGGYFLKLYQHRSYVMAFENAVKLFGMYVDENDAGLSFRAHNDLLLIGGGGHRTGKNGGGWMELEYYARRGYPDARAVARWATQDCMTLDGMPYIGAYSKATPNMYVATGFNKWGMTSAMVAAKVLCALIEGKDDPYHGIFSPVRRTLRPQLAINIAHSLAGIVTPTAPRCPHMGCALKYNPQEHSWDCPCHGSRFTLTGKLINNPATDDKRM